MLAAQAQVIDDLKRQVEWFKRQLFGRKSERFAPEPDPQQMHLGQVLGEKLAVPPAQPQAGSRVPEQYEVIGQKISLRLAQRPGSHVVLKYVREVIKRRDTQTLHCPPAPAGVIEGSRADVSFMAGVADDEFADHLPLYRQHQRITDAGITESRPWLTQLTQQAAQLVEPI